MTVKGLIDKLTSMRQDAEVKIRVRSSCGTFDAEIENVEKDVVTPHVCRLCEQLVPTKLSYVLVGEE